MERKQNFYLRVITTILIIFISTGNIWGEDKVKVFIMAGQSNMEGHNTSISRLQTLVNYAETGNYSIDQSELTSIFLNTVHTDYLVAFNNFPDSPVTIKLEDFLITAGVLSIPPDQTNDMTFDFTDRIFKTVSEYYFTGSGYGYGYDAFKHMSAAMGINRIKEDGKFTNALLFERDDVSVLQYQGSLDSNNKRVFSERYGKLKPGYGYNSGYYGPELIFGNYAGDLFDEDVLLLKIVQGGTDLRVAWRSPSVEANSNNNYTAEELAKESLYGCMIQKANEILDPEVLSGYFPQYAGKTAEISGFVWFQGWNDGFNSTNREQYETNFLGFLNDLRISLQIPELPTGIIQSHVGEPDGEVQMAQKTVAEALDFIEMAVSDDLSNYYHFDPAAQLVIGMRGLVSMESMINPFNPYEGMQNKDIGELLHPGSVDLTDNIFKVKGSGQDIYNYSDEFHYVYWPLSGDGTITTRVLGLSNTNWWAKAGVMIRESLDPESKEVAVVVSSECGIASQWRRETSDRTGWSGTSGGAPYWIKLERSGDSFFAYKSIDGENWIQFSNISVSMVSDVYVGLCVTSHDPGKINTASFDNVEIKE